jgi:hypothetical protein
MKKWLGNSDNISFNLKFNLMKKYILSTVTLLLLTLLTSCEAVETVFKAGMYWGFFLIALVLVVIFWLFSRGKK